MIVMTAISGPSLRVMETHDASFGPGHVHSVRPQCGPQWLYGEFSAMRQDPFGKRPRPDANPVLDPQRASAPPRRSP